MWEHFLQLALVTYTVTSPFLFFLFHKHVLKETWNNDWADKVTVRLYLASNIAAGYLAYILEECGRCA